MSADDGLEATVVIALIAPELAASAQIGRNGPAAD